MIEVVSIRFKSRGKCYFFAPNGLEIHSGDRVIVETTKGLEIADVGQGNHLVEDTAVVQPLRPVIRIATKDDLRVAELNKKREAEALAICQKKIQEHGLEMKLVSAECNFEGNKTTFFFTADGRVDFRELVKDLAAVFRNRIELRQIGVRDEAKMIGGIGICGRPFCCHQFLEDFQPVSTKMAKVQSLSLNPTKISGSCGRLMCCLRYEQEAYEDLVRHVPKQGAFVETIDGYGTAVQVNLLRQTVKVRLDQDTDDTLHQYKANELASVPGGRPKDGAEPPHVLQYVAPEPEEEEEPEDEWSMPLLVVPEQVSGEPKETGGEEAGSGKRSRRRRSRGKSKAESGEKAEQPAAGAVKESTEKPRKEKSGEHPPKKSRDAHKSKAQPERSEKKAKPAEGGEQKEPRRRSKAGGKTVKVEVHASPEGEKGQTEKSPGKEGQHRTRRRRSRPKGSGEAKPEKTE